MHLKKECHRQKTRHTSKVFLKELLNFNSKKTKTDWERQRSLQGSMIPVKSCLHRRCYIELHHQSPKKTKNKVVSKEDFD